ncbi:hypothetical protein [Thalassotalea crassostreae]|uniref:hypothetical protein n=1 Tax=Thalassotalea crassostreae TaxID=1763536 RepID=UPI000838355D|nr:hypothetical protein [Thalassotalea crassostreae]
MKNEKTYLFDNPKNIKRLMQIFYFCCVVLVILDFVIHRHTMHEWDSLWAFYPVYGFVGCVVLVIVASWMRKFLIRPEDYYDNPDSAEPEEKQLKAKGEHHVDD